MRMFLLRLSIMISIHAPTRGATHMTAKFQSDVLYNFNPRSYKRSDYGNALHTVFYGVIFQSTLLQEERRQKCTIYPYTYL